MSNGEARPVPMAILVSMPFFPARIPSIQIGLLAAIGRQHAHSVDTLHLNLEFAAQVGPELYAELCEHSGPELGNWLFAAAAFGEQDPDPAGRFLTDFPNATAFLEELGMEVADLERVRSQLVPAYLRHAEAIVDWGSYRVVGFSSTFQQNTASFALARRLKQRFPQLITIFGGSNFEGDMGREFIRICPWIDYVVDGEGDEVFPEFLAAVAAGRAPGEIAGIVSRASTTPAHARRLTKMDDLPIPDYHEFFRRADDLGIIERSDRHTMVLPFETSRGCWWGQKQHCTFCGLNGATMGFRQKSRERVVAELAELTKRHDTFRFQAFDNIMPMSFFDDLIPQLASEERHYDIYYEVKANLSRNQIKALRDAGICRLQPGIESLSSRVLRIMRKGATASQNINLLRWAAYYGVEIVWNLLWGFPGEREEDYLEQIGLIHNVVHLQPPHGRNRIWLERYSPHYFDRQRFPIKRLQPESSLSYIYPAEFNRDRIAYFFDHEFEHELPDAVFGRLRQRVDDWRVAWQSEPRPWLTYRWSPGRLQIEDGRQAAAPILYSFDSPLAEMYRALSERPLTAARVKEKLGLPWAAEEIAEALELFVAKGLIMRDEQLFLALAIPARATAE
jgi:ribosomal peptide maturation radical SAM protein 1